MRAERLAAHLSQLVLISLRTTRPDDWFLVAELVAESLNSAGYAHRVRGMTCGNEAVKVRFANRENVNQ